MGGVVVDEPQGASHHGVALGAVPPGGTRLQPVEPGAQGGDQGETEPSVEDGLLARLVASDLVEYQVHHWSDIGSRHHDSGWESAEQPVTDVADALVGAADRPCLAVGAAAKGA